MTDAQGILQWKMFGDASTTGNGTARCPLFVSISSHDANPPLFLSHFRSFGLTSATEQCQKGTTDVPGNPNCTALYGSGTLSTVFGLNNFDSIAFLIQYNQGYPMSIKVYHTIQRNFTQGVSLRKP